MTAFKIDDRKPPKTKPQRSSNMIAFVVRSPVSKALCHFLYVSAEHRGSVAKVVLSANSAHKIG